MFENLLSAVDFSLLQQGYSIELNWIGQFARVIIEGVGIIGLGIIVFTLVLKAITMPFDIYQRVTMRKQNLVMRDMKEDLEKLQKQYANDKNLYNQKMMELYKKNGYSMFGACLPMILSLVILIVAFQGFRTYSQDANLDLFVGMSDAYNTAILEHGVVGPSYEVVSGDEENLSNWLFAKPYRLAHEGVENDEFTVDFVEDKTWPEDGIVYRMYTKDDVPYLEVRAEDSTRYIFYYYNLNAETIVEEYQLDIDMLYTNNTDESVKAEIDQIQSDAAAAEESISLETACRRYVVKMGSTAAKNWYHDNSPGFLGIVKNVWYPDVSYNHPIPNYSTFKSQLNVKVTLVDGTKKELASVLDENLYNDLTSELAAEKSEPNGYFIFVVLSIGMMILSQLVTMKSQKESNQYQTVDGQGARTQKMMLIIMPLIYAMFAFMYSAAFSIYMTMSSLIALVITLLSNFFLGRIFKKKEEQKIKETYGHSYAWMKEDGKKDKNNKKKGK